MTIALWVVQDLQASADPENRKRKGKIEQAKNHLVSHVITSGFSRIARNRSAGMTDDDVAVDEGAGVGTFNSVFKQSVVFRMPGYRQTGSLSNL